MSEPRRKRHNLAYDINQAVGRFQTLRARQSRVAAHTLLLSTHSELPLIRRHRLPQNLQILLKACVSWISMEGSREPSIGGRQVARRAMSRRIHRAEHGLGLRVRMLRGSLQILLRPIAILRDAIAIKISLAL